MNSLKIDNKIFNKPDEILEQEKLFYEKLYTSDQINHSETKEFLENIDNFNKLNDSEACVTDF